MAKYTILGEYPKLVEHQGVKRWEVTYDVLYETDDGIDNALNFVKNDLHLPPYPDTQLILRRTKYRYKYGRVLLRSTDELDSWYRFYSRRKNAYVYPVESERTKFAGKCDLIGFLAQNEISEKKHFIRLCMPRYV